MPGAWRALDKRPRKRVRANERTAMAKHPAPYWPDFATRSPHVPALLARASSVSKSAKTKLSIVSNN